MLYIVNQWDTCLKVPSRLFWISLLSENAGTWKDGCAAVFGYACKRGSLASLLAAEKVGSVSWSDCKLISFFIAVISCAAALVSLHRCKCHGKEGPQERGRCKARDQCFWQPCCPDWLRLVEVSTLRLSSRVHREWNWCLLGSYWSPGEPL